MPRRCSRLSSPSGRSDAGLVHVSQGGLDALSAGAGSVPPLSVPLGMWGLEPVQTMPCPHPGHPVAHPVSPRWGGWRRGGLALRAPLCFLGSEQMVSCRKSCPFPGLQIQPRESSKRKLSSPRQQAELSPRPGPSPVLSPCPPARAAPRAPAPPRPSRAPHPSLLPRRQPRRS